MNVQCGSCPAKYAVPDDKVLGRKVRITCKRCGAAIVVDGTGSSSAKPSQPAAASRVPSVAPSVQPASAAARPAAGPTGGAAISTRPSAAARSALKQTMMGVAPPAPGSLAPVPVAAAAPGANSAPAVGKASAALGANAVPVPGTAGAAGAAVPRPGDRDIKRTMIGGLNAPAAYDNRAASAGNQPAVAVPRVQPSPADTTPWTVAVTDDQHEEMPIPRIVELFAAGTINVETYIWKQGMDDWQMPFDIPEIAQALRARGLDPNAKAAAGSPGQSEAARQAEKMPTAPPPAGASPMGVWREPGSWNDGVAWKEPALAPGQEHHDISFDDVTVALAAPQAEALLRDAEAAAALDKDKDDEKDEPTAIFPGGPEAPPLSAPRPVVTVPRPAAGRPAPRPDPKPTSDAAGLAGHPTPPAIAIETKPLGSPVIAVGAPTASTTPASRRATPVERRPDLFSEAHRAGSEDSQPHDDGAGGQKLIGERNESSVLFSLDKVVETEQARAQNEKQREEDLLGLPTAPPPPDAQAAAAPLMSAAEEAAIDSALAAPDHSAPAVEKTAPMPDVEPVPAPAPAAPPPAAYSAPVSQAAPVFAEEPKAEGGSGWLWALLLLLLVGAAAAILIFYLRPAAIFGPPPAPPETAPTALPAPPSPATELAPVVPAPVEPSAAAAPVESGAPAPSASASPEAPLAPRPGAEPRRPREEGSRPIRRERDRKPAEEPSDEAPPATEETKPPVTSPPMEREEGPRP